MSGGHFDYNQHKIGEIADSIDIELERQGKKRHIDDIYGSRDYYERYPEELKYDVYPLEVQNAMKDGVRALRIAEIYAQRIDWFLSGDDGEESFLERLKEDLSKL